VYTVHAKVQRWGNSYGVRLQKRDVEALGLKEGALVELKIAPRKGGPGLDVSTMPTFHDPDPLLSIHHDDILYGPARARGSTKRKRA
jgi:hypothetical protein